MIDLNTRQAEKTSRQCSKCDAEIADDACPLMLFADGRDLMWVYCEECEGGMFAHLELHKRTS